MLNNLVISIEAVAPMFILIMIGYGAKSIGIIDNASAKKLNKLVFNVLFPWLIFNNLYGATIEGANSWKLIIYSIVMLAFAFVVAILISLLIEKDNKRRGAIAQAIYRSNFVVMGFPVVENIFHGGNMSVTTIAITILLPLSNVMAVFVLEMFRSGNLDLKHMLKEIIKNPLIIGAVLGFITIIFKIKLPGFVERPIFSLYNASTPMALIVLGASMNLDSIESCKKELSICVFCRLILLPAIILTGGALMGFRGIEFVTLIALFAAPTPISSYTMAEQMDSDGKLAGGCVVISSAAASFTMFFWIFIFKMLGMF